MAQKDRNRRAGRGREVRGSRDRGRDAAPSSLETNGNNVTGDVPGGFVYELLKCRCRCWFCPDCALVEGLKLRARLLPKCQEFTGLLMLTLTIDPSLFASPSAAFSYVRDRRCVGRLMQDLRRAGALFSDRYFCVLEWQKDTEQVHYHLLVDANFISQSLLTDLWGKNRPPHAGPVEDSRPPFGWVWISKRDFDSGIHAAHYATKYLIKTPEHGFPEWVLNEGGARRIRRYATNRGFWGEDQTERTKVRLRRKARRTRQRNYRERMQDCGQGILVVFHGACLGGGVSPGARCERVNLPPELLKHFPRDPDTGRRFVLVDSRDQLEALIRVAARRVLREADFDD